MKTLLTLLILIVAFALICIISLLVGFFHLKQMNEKRKNEYWKYVNRE